MGYELGAPGRPYSHLRGLKERTQGRRGLVHCNGLCQFQQCFAKCNWSDAGALCILVEGDNDRLRPHGGALMRPRSLRPRPAPSGETLSTSRSAPDQCHV